MDGCDACSEHRIGEQRLMSYVTTLVSSLTMLEATLNAGKGLEVWSSFEDIKERQ